MSLALGELAGSLGFDAISSYALGGDFDPSKGADLLLNKGVELVKGEFNKFEESLKSEMEYEDYKYAVSSKLAYDNIYYGDEGGLESTQEKLQKFMPEWKVDKDLSDKETLVLNDGENTILSYRGTNPHILYGGTGEDLAADFNILIGANRDNMDYNILQPKRFTDAESKFKAVEQKYGKDNLMLTGWSLGGTLADYTGRKHNVDAVVFNAAESPVGVVAGLLDTKPKQTTRFYTTGQDLISKSNVLYAGRADVKIVPMKEELKQNIFGSHDIKNFMPPDNILPLKPSVGKQGIPEKERPVIATPAQQAIINQQENGELQRIQNQYCNALENQYYLCREAPKLEIKR
jgi:hypothetical protein